MIVYEYGNKNSKNILIQAIGNHELNIIESEVQAINDFSVDYHLLAVKVEDWNEELSPWEADAITEGSRVAYEMLEYSLI